MRIVLIVDSMHRHLFFFRLATALKSVHQIYFTSSEPLSILLARLGGFQGKHLSRREKCRGNFSSSELSDAAQNSIEVLNGVFTKSEAVRDIELIAEGFYAYIKEHKIQKTVFWNGQQLLGRAAKLAALKAGIPCQYLELSNLPGKIFSDPEGVNALSSIARNIGIIDRLPSVPEAFHQSWLSLYEAEKRKPLPQATKKPKELFLSVVNHVAKIFFKSTCAASLENKKRIIFTSVARIAPPKPTEKFTDYIFLPLQVSTDTQIKLHSEYDNIDAIRYAYAESKRNGLALVVKVHPAENNLEEVDMIHAEKDKLGFALSNMNTIELIKGSASVITINSTVGMEALLYEKPVTTLGRCLYKEFNKERLKKYIHEYLISDAEYFEEDTISSHAALRLVDEGQIYR